MAKILFGILLLLILTIFVITIIVTRRSDERANKKTHEEDKMFWMKQLCPQCKTGRDSYMLDEHSESCPYIGCWENGICQFYVQIEENSKTIIINKM